MTVLPTTPAVSFRPKPGTTVYSVQAECLPSDTVTLWLPVVACGTVNPQGRKVPSRSVLQFVETLFPSKVTLTVSFFSKPLPVTVARPLTGPSSEVSSTDGLTLKRVESWNPLSSIALTLWLPAVASGTSNSQSKSPLAPVVQALPASSVRATLVSPKSRKTERSVEKPLPLPVVVQLPDVGRRLPSNETLRMRCGWKLPPLSLTVRPTLPADGFRLMP